MNGRGREDTLDREQVGLLLFIVSCKQCLAWMHAEAVSSTSRRSEDGGRKGGGSW
jgi:hypothetical protein